MGLKVFEGDKWGALTCTYSGMRTFEEEDGPVTIERKVWCYVLQCECGKEVVVPRWEFKGKRAVRDCGCGVAIQGGSMMVTVSVPRELQKRVLDMAVEDGVLVSHAWARLARWGLERREDEREQNGKKVRTA